MNLIINLTQHVMTQEQYFLNGEELTEVKFRPYNGTSISSPDYIKRLLNFNDMPSKKEIITRAINLAAYASGLLNQAKNDGDDKLYALIGGAPYLMPPLEEALKQEGITPLYAFSKRVSVETTQPDGSVIKTAKFVHEGYIEA